MKPEWKQDIKSMDHPNNPLPQFELMGYQEDIQQDQKTLKQLASIFGGLIAITVFSLVILHFKDASSVHKDMMARKGVDSQKKVFLGNLSLKVLGTQKIDVLESMFGNTNAKKGFRFFVVHVRITNNATENFRISPYGLAVFTDDGKRYNPHVGTAKLPNAMTGSSLEPQASIEGDFLYEIPIQAKPKSLEIKSYNGPLATYRF